MNEKIILEQIASQSLYSAGVNTDMIIHSFNIFKRYIHGKTLLEMGPAEGVMTDMLVKLGMEISVVEGSESLAVSLARRHPNIEVIHSLFEDFKPKKKFDNIILGHVLEHVADPIAILSQAREWLSEDGIIVAAVPNARSLHRQMAVIMGLLSFEEQLNDTDRHHGHRRVYTPETFRRDFLSAGLDIKVFGGYWLKPLSNKQIEDHWTPEMIEASMVLGERYPDIAGEIYIVASRRVRAS